MIEIAGSGGSGGNYFTFDRSLPGQIGKSIGNLEDLFQQIFSRIDYFQQSLIIQKGKAASTLKKNLNEHTEFMAKSAPILLHFADLMRHFMLTIEAADNEETINAELTGRSEWQYTFSEEGVADEIQLEPATLERATEDFQENLMNVHDVFDEFSSLLNEAMEGVNLPWDDFTSIWNDTKQKIKSITEETEKHIEKLMKEAMAFLQEITRVDQMISQQIHP